MVTSLTQADSSSNQVEEAVPTTKPSTRIPESAFNKPTCQQEKSMTNSQGIELLNEYFGESIEQCKLHSFYTCSVNCSQLPESEINRIKECKAPKLGLQKKKKGMDMFRHSWLTDRNTSYCEKTGIWWLIYVEGSGMYCLMCRMHNTTNKYNKLNTFNISPSMNFKHSAIIDHKNGTGHISTQIYELERRNSSLAHQHKEAHETIDSVTFNALLTSYWLGKEEVASKKLLSLIDLEIQIGVTEMTHFKNRSERSQRDMRILIGQLIKSRLIQKIKYARWYSVLVDEVTDCATIEQLLIYVGYVNADGNANFDFLDVRDVLEKSDSPNAETIFNIITEELRSCGLSPQHLCGFGSDGASVMTGVHGGVGARLQNVSSIMLRSHCISHRLALACGDSNETVKYVSTVEVTLRQLWKWLEYPKRCSAFVKVCKNLQQIQVPQNPEKERKLSRRLAVKIQKACRTRWLSTGQSVASVCRNLVAIMLTLRQFKEQDATAQGLLTRMNNTKFVGTMFILNAVLPQLNILSKLFQKDHTCYMSIQPALQATKAYLTSIRCELDIVNKLQSAIQPDGMYAQLELRLTEKDQVPSFLKGLLSSYTTALEKNLDRRFSDASPVLQAFSVFDPTILPKATDQDFTGYGVKEVEIMSKQFHLNSVEALAQWQNFKYLMSTWNVPEAILRGEDISPTQYVLNKLVKEQASHRINFSYLVDAAQICLTQPLSNAVVERGASAVKRIKTRLRSTMKNDMLSSLLHISLNGPPSQSTDCKSMLTEATQIWRKTHIRNLPPLKKLPKLSGCDHADSLFHVVTRVDCATQVDLGGK